MLGQEQADNNIDRRPIYHTNILHFPIILAEIIRSNCFENSKAILPTTSVRANHVSQYHTDMILSRLCDTMYHVCIILYLRQVLDTEKKYLADVLSFGPCNSECICSKNPFQITFGAKKICFVYRVHGTQIDRLMDFWNVYTLICKEQKRAHMPDIFFLCLKLVSNEVSRRHDTQYHTDVIVSRLCDSFYHADVIWP